MGKPLTIGHISYANCEPFFHYLHEFGFKGDIRSGVPAQLNRLLAKGELDLSPSSSYEYLRNWRDYLILPGLSISSFAAVKSVLLFSRCPLEDLNGTEIFLTGESASSVHLLQILLREHYGFEEVLCRVPGGELEDHVSKGDPALLIGDRALKTSQEMPAEHIYDLGDLWARATGLPFVFALWILRRPVAKSQNQEVAAFYRQLCGATHKALDNLPGLAEQLPHYNWLDQQSLVDYWQSMSYRLEEEHLKGLRLYAELLVKYDLLPEMPGFDYYDVATERSG